MFVLKSKVISILCLICLFDLSTSLIRQDKSIKGSKLSEIKDWGHPPPPVVKKAPPPPVFNKPPPPTITRPVKGNPQVTRPRATNPNISTLPPWDNGFP
ncbi:hypothetical protein HDU92_007770 [Lobulomyces angularis]|nr:hypothetical protein HDU92_007770 [Lobulomyces angularis]